MGKNIVLIVACLAAAGLAAIVVQQQRSLTQLQAALAQARQQASTAEAKAAEAGQAVRTLQKEAVAIRRELGEVEAASAAPAPAPADRQPAATAAARPARTNEAAPFAGLAKMIKAPGMKSMIRAQQQGQLDMAYGSLFKGLALPAEDQATLKGLLLDKQMAMVELSMGMMDGSATPDQRKDFATKVAELNKSYDEKIKALLGDEGYAVYQEYEATQPERMQVNMFKQSLSGTEALTDDQEHDLIRALYDERKNVPAIARQFDRTNPPDPSTFTEAMITNQLAVMSQLQARNVERAAKVLTPPQLEEFKKNQEQMRTMQEMGMRMASQMFGAKKESSP